MNKIFACMIFVFSGVLLAKEPTLTVETKTNKIVFTRSELLKRNDIETITVQNDPVYSHHKIKYWAIKVTNLFEKIKIADDNVVEFKALDGFSAPLSKQRLLNKSPHESIAYIAIERADKHWPPIGKGKSSAGPFYLIWKNSELSHIGPEEWPYMLAGFEIKSSLKEVYPKIFPSDELSKDDPTMRGFHVFVKNCFACHTINQNGASHIGPDLNDPMNPTEYFHEAALRKLIRNPKSVRTWSNSIMRGFDTGVLSDKDLDDLITYLKYMAGHKN